MTERMGQTNAVLHYVQTPYYDLPVSSIKEPIMQAYKT